LEKRHEKLIDLLKELNSYDLIELCSRFELEDAITEKKDLIKLLEESILNNYNNLAKLYSTKTLEFLKEIVFSQDGIVKADQEFNILVCDGLVGIVKEDDVDKFYITNDIKEKLKKAFSEDAFNNIVRKYDEIEHIVSGMVNLYGIISITDMYDIYTEVEKESLTYDEFEKFIFNRDSLQSTYILFEHGEEVYLVVEDIEEPDDMLHEILHNENVDYKILKKSEYIEIGSSSRSLCREPIDFIKEYLEQKKVSEVRCNDLIYTLWYDIKTNHKDELIQDVLTYVEFDTNEEYEKINEGLDKLYKNTPIWTLKGHCINEK